MPLAAVWTACMSSLRIRLSHFLRHTAATHTYDVHTGRQLKVLQRRKEVKKRTIEARRSYNSTVRGQRFGL